LLDARQFHLPSKLPDGAAFALRDVAAKFRDSLVAPATHEERTVILGELRLKTITREENTEEARARFRLLRQAVETVPVGILREAAAKYAAENKWFPTAVAELLAYVTPLVEDRRRTAHRLMRLADAAEAQAEHERRVKDDPLTPEAAAAIIDEFNLRPESTARIVRHEGPPKMPTRADYLAMGIDPDAIGGTEAAA